MKLSKKETKKWVVGTGIPDTAFITYHRGQDELAKMEKELGVNDSHVYVTTGGK